MDKQDAYKSAIEAGHKSDGKADGGKVRMSLLMVQFGRELRGIASVLTFGAVKYPKPPLDDSWRGVPNAQQRYSDALYRHLDKVLVEGEWLDPESGESHFAHAHCNLLFLEQLIGEERKGIKLPTAQALASYSNKVERFD